MSDWLMVGITAVYVATTIVICVLNYKTLNESRRQFNELNKQYFQQLNLNCMPVLQIDYLIKPIHINGSDECHLSDQHRNSFLRLMRKTIYLRIKNVGKGIAQDVYYNWEERKSNRQLSIASLPPGDDRVLKVRFIALKHHYNNCHPCINIYYSDINGVTYKQRAAIHFDISNNRILFLNTSITAPEKITKTGSY